MKKLSTIAAFVLALTMLFSACSSGAGNSEKSGPKANQTASKDTLTVAFRSEASNLDPHNNSSLTSFCLENLIYDRLIEKTSTGEFVPMLATKWEKLNDTTFRFYLRQDVTFQNGEKLTAEDVKYTIGRAITMSGSASYFTSFDGENTKVVDPYTIDIKLKTPFAPIFNYLSSARGNIVCKKTMEEVGSAAYGRNPVGTGKFKFVKWVSGDRIELTRNDSYWGNKPAYKTLVARTIIESASRAIELETGGVDVSLFIDSADIDRLKNNKNTQIISGPGYTFSYFIFNTQKFDLFKDQRVREALSIAVDIPALVESVYKGSATIADSVISNKIPTYVKTGTIKYDPERAKQLLKDAGFDFSKEIIISINTETQTKDAAEIIQNKFKAIGVNARIESYDQAQLSTKMSAGQLMFTFASSAAATGDPDQAFSLWLRGTTQFTHKEETIFQKLEAGRAEYDTSKRAQLYADAQKLSWEYHGIIPIAYSNVTYGARANVKNLDADPGNTPDLSKIIFSN